MRFRRSVLFSLLLLTGLGAAFGEKNEQDLQPRNDAVDRKPRQTIVPVYPERALEERLEGKVEVCFNVDRDGQTSRIGVRSSSNRIFEKPSILAVRASSYAPLAADKTLSGIKTCRTFRFKLDPVVIESPREYSGDGES